MGRESFLERVKQAAQRGRAYRVQLHAFPPETGYLGISGDRCEALAREVAAVGGQPFIAEGLAAAQEHVRDLLVKYEVKSALCWQHTVLDEFGLSTMLADREIVRHDYDSLREMAANERREQMVAADMGISSADLAVGESGSLLVCARPGQERVASLLPPVHVAMIKSAQIVPDLIDAIAWLSNQTDLPSNVALITGPSKTGDIELQLTTGVHGPGIWHVVIVREAD